MWVVPQTYHDPIRQDAVLLLTDPPRTGPAGQLLTPAALAALYGAPLAVCPGCGRPHG